MAEKDPRLVKAQEAAEEALELHVTYRRKIQVMPKCPVPNYYDFFFCRKVRLPRAGKG